MSASLHLHADNAPVAEGGDESDFYTQVEPPHSPRAFWLGCCDARVPETARQVFVHRNLANLFPKDDSNAHAALYYAVHDRRVQRVIVVGHTFCGGANAALQASKRDSGATDPGLPTTHPFNRWLDPLTSFVRELRRSSGFLGNDAAALTFVVAQNVRKQVDELCGSKIIQDAWNGTGSNRNLVVEGQVYDIINNTVQTIYTRSTKSEPVTSKFPSP